MHAALIYNVLCIQKYVWVRIRLTWLVDFSLLQTWSGSMDFV